MKKLTIVKDWYGEDERILYKKSRIQIKEGVTVLVGCNGSGKTTLLSQIKHQLEKENIEYFSYDNFNDGGSRSKEKVGYYGQMDLLAEMICSSEGENIGINMGQQSAKMGKYSREVATKQDELWFLLDAIDSGLSIDNIIDIKEYLFKTIIEHNTNKKVYIIVSANEYELCRNEQCFDVTNCEYVEFKDYEEYRNFIINSKKIKEESFEMNLYEKRNK